MKTYFLLSLLLVSCASAFGQAVSLDEAGVPISTYQGFRQRFVRNFQDNSHDCFMCGKDLTATSGFQVDISDFEKSDTLKGLYLSVYTNKGLDKSAAEVKYGNMLDYFREVPEDLTVCQEDISFFARVLPLGNLGEGTLRGIIEHLKTSSEPYYSVLMPGYPDIKVTKQMAENTLEGFRHEKIADTLFGKGDYSNALKEYVKALSYNQDDWILYMDVGNCYIGLKNKALSDRYLDVALMTPSADAERIERNRKAGLENF
jgi:hypothetical protein